MTMQLIAELEAVIDAFEVAKIAYAVCGGLALALHGHPRATMDIDLLLPRDELVRAVPLAHGLGFDIPDRLITFGLRTGTPREVQRISKLDPVGELYSLMLYLGRARPVEPDELSPRDGRETP